MSGDTANLSCSDHLEQLQHGYRLLYFINPVEEKQRSVVWTQRTEAWNALYLTNVLVCSLCYLLIGVLAAFFFLKKGTRIKTKTFYVIYTCIALLGFSRVLFLTLDPYGIFGWITKLWLPWIIISRLLSAAGFPCLTASYTLIFLTLLKANEMSENRWHKSWAVILAIVLPHFVIAVLAETIANTSPYPALASLIICDAIFIVWGLIVSIIFLVVIGLQW